MIFQIIFFILLVAADRFTKFLAVKFLKGQSAAVIIKDVLELRYLENTGAAFGIFKNMQWMFYIITVVIMIVIIILWIFLNRKLRKYCAEHSQQDTFRPLTFKNTIFLNYLFAALAAGAIGNFIDRVAQQYVVDFIYFRIIDFPIFNFADICVTLTAVLLIVFFIFFYKEDPNFAIFGNKK